MQLIVLLTVALQESTERCECYSLRASSPFLKFRGSREKWHESRTRKEMQVHSLTVRFAWHSKWRACSQATSVMGNITVWREPSRWVRLGNQAEGKLGWRKRDGTREPAYKLKRSPVVSLTFRSLTSWVVPLRSERALRRYMLRSLSHDTKKCDTHVYSSFFQPLIRRK